MKDGQQIRVYDSRLHAGMPVDVGDAAGKRGVSRYERNPSNQVDLHWYVGFLAQRPLISISYTPFFALVNIRFNYIH